MKKTLVLFLVFLYMGTATGVTLHLHYCMGKMIELGLVHAAAAHCDNCGMEKSESTKKGCCKEELKKVKTDDSRNAPDNTFKSAHQLPALMPEKPVYSFASELYPSVTEAFPLITGPPVTNPVPVYVMNCTFLI